MANTQIPLMSEAKAREMAKAACPDNPAMEELVVLEQMGIISDTQRAELQRLRKCVL